MNILVLLGTSHLSFHRLTNALVDIDGHDIYVQHGHTKLHVDLSGKAFLSRRNLLKKIEWSDLVVSQGGVGSIMDVLEFSKPLIIVPRLEEFNELVGDQIRFSDVISSLGLAKVCYNTENLTNYISFYNNPCSGFVLDYQNVKNEIESFL